MINIHILKSLTNFTNIARAKIIFILYILLYLYRKLATQLANDFLNSSFQPALQPNTWHSYTLQKASSTQQLVISCGSSLASLEVIPPAQILLIVQATILSHSDFSFSCFYNSLLWKVKATVLQAGFNILDK